MRNILLCSLILYSILISSCSTSTPPPSTPEVVSVYSTSAAEPWLTSLYDCAGTASRLSRVDDPSAADISLRVGEPEVLSGSAAENAWNPAFDVTPKALITSIVFDDRLF